ncbi:acyl-CoA thioesterase [Rhodococcus sp. NPDC058521]|uniref:acyl-CoA thioesterase n=1 Tax=Rhodococcus sp. NPDC058521 TaxID=3346536 RepID=UPI0036534777
MPDQVFSCEVQVRWGDSDRLGHINNVRYVEYMQEARILFFAHEMEIEGERPHAMVVRKMDVEFLRPATDSSGPLTVEMSVLHLGNSSYTMRHVIKDRGGEAVATGDAVLVAFDPRTEKSRLLSDAERSMLQRNLVPAATT